MTSLKVQPKASGTVPPKTTVAVATERQVYVVAYVVPDDGAYNGLSVEAIYSSLFAAQRHPKNANGTTHIYVVILDNGQGGRELNL